MAKLLSHKEVAAVKLLDLEVSEDELGVYILCMKYILDNADDRLIDELLGAYREEVEGMRGDLVEILSVTGSDILDVLSGKEEHLDEEMNLEPA